MLTNYLLPPIPNDQTGQLRKAGFEFEFGNLSVIETATALQQRLNGTLQYKSPFEAVIINSTLGKIKIERDAQLLKSVKYRTWLEALGIEFSPGTLAHDIESNIDHISRSLIPCEVITEPIPIDQLNKLNSLVDTLREIGAEGTQDSFIYAFGLHINLSLPDSATPTLVRYLQAFLLLNAWLVERGKTDITRRFFTKYIDPFPLPYMEKILDTHYCPATTRLICDYIEFNPTRNRALDMLPIFCTLDQELVLKCINAEERSLVKARPAFHYRLPDCRINIPDWSVTTGWNLWIVVERLAYNDKLRAELIEQWRSSMHQFAFIHNASWVAKLNEILPHSGLLHSC